MVGLGYSLPNQTEEEFIERYCSPEWTSSATYDEIGLDSSRWILQRWVLLGITRGSGTAFHRVSRDWSTEERGAEYDTEGW